MGAASRYREAPGEVKNLYRAGTYVRTRAEPRMVFAPFRSEDVIPTERYDLPSVDRHHAITPFPAARHCGHFHKVIIGCKKTYRANLKPQFHLSGQLATLCGYPFFELFTFLQPEFTSMLNKRYANLQLSAGALF